jgi:hypothetical protein
MYIPNMYLESYMSRVFDIPKYRANKDKDKINLVYFIRFIHYKLVSYDKQCLPHSSGEFIMSFKCHYIYIYIYTVYIDMYICQRIPVYA